MAKTCAGPSSWPVCVLGHQWDAAVPYWIQIDALARAKAVNIEHEDASYSRIEGLALAAGNLRAAAEKM